MNVNHFKVRFIPLNLRVSPFNLRVIHHRLPLILLISFAFITACVLFEGRALAGDKTRSRAERALREGDYEQAEKLFRQLLEKNEKDTNARLGLSYTMLKERNLQGAYEHAARVLTFDSLSARAHALLGATLLASGDFRSATDEFRIALTLRETEALAIAGLAMIDYYENRLNQSLDGLRRAAFLDQREPDFIYNLAQAAARTEHFKEAADAYERFLRVAPHTDADRRARIRGLIDFMRYLGTQNSLYTQSGANRSVVPFDTVSNRPVIQVRLNGSKEPLRFVLDTGSGMSVISEETAQRFGIKPVARGGEARAVGGGGRFEIVYGFLNSIEIGDARVENVPIFIRRFFDEGKPADGYIGLALINKFIATVDYGSRTFSLVRQRDSSGPSRLSLSRIEIPIRTTSSGFLSGEVELEGIQRPLNFIIDTGASISVVAETLAMREEMDRFMQGTRMRVYGAAGIAEDVKVLMLPSVKFGSSARDKIPAAVLDLDPVNETTGFIQNGIIGGNYLRHYRVTFDFKKGIVSLEPLIPPGPESERGVPEGAAAASARQ